MKRAALALVISATCASAHAQDQAILACENIIKAELIAPKSYEAVSRVALGRTVQVTYDAANKYNAPLRTTDRCNFKQTPAGWVLSSDYSEDAMKAEFSAVTERFKSGSISREDGMSKAQEIERRFSAMLISDATREMRAKAAGPYPIPPHMTSLSQ